MHAYVESIRQQVERLKRIATPAELARARVACGDGVGWLVPVCDLHRDDAELVALLADWRARHASAFPSQFKVTHEGTARWLARGILENENRLLLLVCDAAERPIGHVGLCDYLNEQRAMEAENIVRGVDGAVPGLMSAAMRALLELAYGWGAREVHLRVFRDNAHALAFYRRLGFRDDILIPLRRHVEGEAIIYRPSAPEDPVPPDKEFVRMVHAHA